MLQLIYSTLHSPYRSESVDFGNKCKQGAQLQPYCHTAYVLYIVTRWGGPGGIEA